MSYPIYDTPPQIIPKRGERKPYLAQYPFAQLEVGKCFVVAKIRGKSFKTLYNLSLYWHKKTGFKFHVFLDNDKNIIVHREE